MAALRGIVLKRWAVRTPVVAREWRVEYTRLFFGAPHAENAAEVGSERTDFIGPRFD
jgi:hypothetical protein